MSILQRLSMHSVDELSHSGGTGLAGDTAVHPETILALAEQVSATATQKIGEINLVTKNVRMLALNALIEASRAGENGRGFTVVANEVKAVSSSISKIAGELEQQLVAEARNLSCLGRSLVNRINDLRGVRLADSAANMIDIIDRNLYERSCDVRWWATDASVVDCASDPTPANRDHASRRLGVILSSYTVYLDLWIADCDGNVIASGRPQTYPRAIGANVAQEPWFRAALATTDGTCFTAADIALNELMGQPVATFGTAIRRNGEERGEPIGVLGIFFNWEPQAQSVVRNMQRHDEEPGTGRCLLLDARHRVIASSDDIGLLTEVFPLQTDGKQRGFYIRDGKMIGFARTLGYETYEGLGWYGVIIRNADHK